MDLMSETYDYLYTRERWLAPELKENSYISRFRNTKTDTFAFACLCSVHFLSGYVVREVEISKVFTDRVPFHEISSDWTAYEKYKDGQRPDRPPHPSLTWGLTDELWDIIQRCWAQNPEDRPPMAEVVTELTGVQRLREMQPAPRPIDPNELHPSRYVCRIPFFERRMVN